MAEWDHRSYDNFVNNYQPKDFFLSAFLVIFTLLNNRKTITSQRSSGDLQELFVRLLI